jgi:serine phosphatase RsbU (regulator of sigma subunit)
MRGEDISTAGPHLVVQGVTGSRLISLVPGDVPLTIGRGKDNDLQFGDETVSREHARVMPAEDCFSLEDVGSKHGTFVNGTRLVRARQLQHGDRIKLGRSREHLVFYRGLHPVPDPTPSFEISATSENIADFTALLEITRALNSSLRLDEVLSKILEAVVALAEAERAELLLGKSLNELEVELSLGVCEPHDPEKLFSNTVVERVLETGQPEIIADLDNMDITPRPGSLDRMNLGSVICVPLRFARLGRTPAAALSETGDSDPSLQLTRSTSQPGGGAAPVDGVLYVERSSPVHRFTPQDLALFESFAASAAVAIQNAKRCEELLQKRALDEEIRVAEKIQARLLQQEFPAPPWVQVHARNDASRQVGGDYYQFVEHASGEVTFALGDVSGKGIPAALLMSTLQSTFLMANIDEGDLAEICAIVSRNLFRRTSPWHFATFFAGRLTPDRRLVYVNAGHNPPLLIRSGEIETLSGGGLPLGLFLDKEYELQTRALEPGDLIVCYTDGVTEATDSSEEEFGTERLLEVVAADVDVGLREMTDRIFQAVADHGAGASQADDITVALVRIL